MIQSKIGGNTARIETVNPYEGDYNSVVEQGKKEVDGGFAPEIKPMNINMSDYDTIVLGTPVWWYTYAPAVKTFLDENDFSGKTVYAFATNGGWIGHTFNDVERECIGAEIKPGLNIRFDEERLITPESEIYDWINKIK